MHRSGTRYAVGQTRCPGENSTDNRTANSGFEMIARCDTRGQYGRCQRRSSDPGDPKEWLESACWKSEAGVEAPLQGAGCGRLLCTLRCRVAIPLGLQVQNAAEGKAGIGSPERRHEKLGNYFVTYRVFLHKFIRVVLIVIVSALMPLTRNAKIRLPRGRLLYRRFSASPCVRIYQVTNTETQFLHFLTIRKSDPGKAIIHPSTRNAKFIQLLSPACRYHAALGHWR